MMVTFHFEFEGVSYKAEATISNNNGEISYDILRILNDQSNQQAIFKGFELGPIVRSDLSLIKAIFIGIDQYLKNYPINHVIPAP